MTAKPWCWICHKPLIRIGVGLNVRLVCPLHGSRGSSHLRDEPQARA